MRITRVHIDGFGTWSGLELDGLAEGLNVFYGPNEAGKTTLLQFIRSAFFGFSPQRRARYLPPVHGGRGGGSVEVMAPDGRLTILRHDEGAAAGTCEGRFAVCGADGDPCDRQALARLFGPVDDGVYSNVFAVGLREIQELGTLGDTEAADFLYELTTGLDRVSLADVMRELAASRERLLASGGAQSQIGQLFAERERLFAQAQEAQALSRRYAQLAGQRKTTQTAIDATEKEVASREKSARLIEVACTIHARWHERQAVQQELDALGDTPRVAHDAAGRLDRALARRRQARTRLRRLRARQAFVKKQIAQLAIDDGVWRHAPRIEALLEQEAWVALLENQARTLDAERSALGERLAAEHQALGLAPGSPLLVDARQSRQALRQLRPLAREVRAARGRQRQAEEQAQRAKQSLAQAGEAVEAALASRSQRDVLAAVESAGNQAAKLRRRVQLDQRLDDMKQHETDLKTGARQWLHRQLLPAWVLVGLGALFVTGVVAILCGLLLPQSLLGPAGWALAVLGAAGAGTAAAAKIMLERSATRHYEACQQQLSALEAQMDDARGERDELDAQLPKGGGPMLARLQAAEKELAALEELLPLSARRESAENESRSAEERRQASHGEYRNWLRQWRQALVVAGLDERLSPKQLGRMTLARKRLLAMRAQQTAQEQELNAKRQELRVLAQRVDQLAADIGAPPSDDASLSGKLRALRERLRQHTALAQQRETLEDALRRLRDRRAKLSRSWRRWGRRGRRLMSRYGAEGPEHLRRLALQSARVELLSKQRAALDKEIAAVLAPHASEEEARELLDRESKQQLEDRWTRLAGEIQSARDQLRAAHEQLGRLDQEMATLAADRSAGDVLLRLGMVEGQLRERIARWRTLAVAELLLERIRRRYETERQPETLREASIYLARLTDGHYTRVWTPIDQRVLRVDDRDGNTLPLEVLSRGTREQLFLSLRLALVTAYARRGIELPLVLDDVLVNFDAQRARLAAALLRDFAAEGRQLLVFTCHEHVYRLFKSQKAAVRELPPSAAAVETADPPQRARTVRALAAPTDGAIPSASVTIVSQWPPVAAVVSEMTSAGNGVAAGLDSISTVVSNGHVAPAAAPIANGHRDWPHAPDEDTAIDLAARHMGNGNATLARIGRREGPFAGSIWHDPVELEFGDE